MTPRRVVKVELVTEADDGSLLHHIGFRVQHNDARGPYKGGLRYHPSMDEDHAAALAALMTWKTAIVDVPSAAPRGGINCDPARLSRTELDAITRAFVEQTKEVIGPNQDIPAPDVNTNGEVMSWIMDEYSRHYGNVQRFSWEEDRITEELEKVMVRSYAAVRAVAEEKVDLRTAAFILGIRRVGKAATSRRSTREPISFD